MNTQEEIQRIERVVDSVRNVPSSVKSLPLSDLEEVARDASGDAWQKLFAQLEGAGLDTKYLHAYGSITNVLGIKEKTAEDIADMCDAIQTVWEGK